MRCVVFCDGASTGKVGAGGWGFVVVSSEGTQEHSGGSKKTTNQRMEIIAAIMALEHIEAESRVLMVSDSAYLVNCMNQRWYKKWQNNGWISSTKDPVKNRDLWERLISSLARHTRVTFKHIRGHGKCEDGWYRLHNDRADHLAVEAKLRIIEKAGTP